MQDPEATLISIPSQLHPVTFTTTIMNSLISPAPVLVRMTPPSVTLARMIMPIPESDHTPSQEHYRDRRDSPEVISHELHHS